MKLETVSKVKGWVAVAGWSVCVLGIALSTLGEAYLGFGVVGGFGFWLGIIYTVKWMRLRRRMRMVEYQGRVWNQG